MPPEVTFESVLVEFLRRDSSNKTDAEFGNRIGMRRQHAPKLFEDPPRARPLPRHFDALAGKLGVSASAMFSQLYQLATQMEAAETYRTRVEKVVPGGNSVVMAGLIKPTDADVEKPSKNPAPPPTPPPKPTRRVPPRRRRAPK